jgi:hypothetical protein
MKIFPRLLAACAAFLTVASFIAGSALASPVVQRLTIQFNTLEGGKAPLSAVSVFIQNSAGVVIAKYEAFAKGAFAANSTSPEFPIPNAHGPITTDDLSAFKVMIQMQAAPGKSDTWHFKFTVAAHLANGAVIPRQSPPCVLTSHSGGAASVPCEMHL